ncbi:MAG: hypothetical protein H8D23_05645, partial [Candidatus Brocadiales bacterium]|nr:hypothetical protein [Candidatus Brocadiales bacterium]
NNKKEIDKVLADFNKMVPKEMRQQVRILKDALKKKKVEEVLVVWKKIKKMFARTEETGKKISPLPYRAIELYHQLEGWFGLMK